MPTKAASYKKGIQMHAGRGGSGSMRLPGDAGNTTLPLGRAHGNNGRDERSAANMANDGNIMTGNELPRKHQYK